MNKATNCLRDTVSSLSPILKNRETPKYTGILGNFTELMQKKHKYKSIEDWPIIKKQIIYTVINNKL